MKTIITITFIAFAIVFSNCKATKNTSPKVAQTEASQPKSLAPEQLFELPYDSATMTDAQKKQFVTDFEKGIIIYNTVCANCHNKLVNGVQVVPDFSLPQLMDYEMRIQYPSHENKLTETNLTALEFDQVVHYLRYKKKSGVHF
jgi:cytochrome c5